MVASAGVMAVAVAVCVSFIGSAAAGTSSMKAKHGPPYTFVVSNNFLGNDWRPQVEKLAQLTAKLPPFKGKVNVKIVNSGATNQAQIADLNSIIQTKPDAIMLIPGSSTALNPTIRRACAAGILVFTISAPVTEKCAWNVNQDFYGGMKGVGQWMGKVLQNKGSILVDQGIAGLGISKDIENGFLAGLKKTGPAVKVAGSFPGQYAPGPEQSGISNLLAGNPDINGVMTQGYCTPVFNAFKQAGKQAVPATCYGYNGELGACAQTGHACAVLSGSPDVMQIAMKHSARRSRRQAGTAEEQDHPGPDDALHHGDAEGQRQRSRPSTWKSSRRTSTSSRTSRPASPCRTRSRSTRHRGQGCGRQEVDRSST